MLRKEWSLIVNSLVIQLAAGMFTFLAIYRLLLTSQAGRETAITLTAFGMLLAGPLIITGMILSLFHLGQPLRAYRAVTHIGTSWLSREVLFTGVFFVLWLANTWMDRSGTENVILVWLTLAAGLLCVLSMSGIYSATGKPGWSGTDTYISFFTTLIVFGSVSSMIVMIQSPQAAEIFPVRPLFSIILALLVLVVRLIRQLKLISVLKATPKEWSLDSLVTAAPLPLSDERASLHQSLTLWGWTLSFLGVALALYALTAGKDFAGPLMLAAIAALVLVGEILGRMGFNSLGLTEERIKLESA